jgi:hypothetical protein
VLDGLDEDGVRSANPGLVLWPHRVRDGSPQGRPGRQRGRRFAPVFCGTTEVVPCHKSSGAEAWLIGGCCGTTQVVPVTKRRGSSPGWFGAWGRCRATGIYGSCPRLKPVALWTADSPA